MYFKIKIFKFFSRSRTKKKMISCLGFSVHKQSNYFKKQTI